LEQPKKFKISATNETGGSALSAESLCSFGANRDIFLKICSPDDLIVLKAFANRDKDWNDIKTVCIRQKNLDWDYITTQLAPLAELKETPEVLTKLEKLRREISK